MLSEAGQDGEWLRRNMEAFEQKAEDGDEEFKDLVEDVKSRKVFRKMLLLDDESD